MLWYKQSSFYSHPILFLWYFDLISKSSYKIKLQCPLQITWQARWRQRVTNAGDTQYCQAVIRGWSPLSSQSPTVNTVVTRNNTAHLMKASWSNWNIQMKLVWKTVLISVEMLGTLSPGWSLWRGGREDHHVGHRLGLSYGPSISSIVILTTGPANPTSLFACYPTAVI